MLPADSVLKAARRWLGLLQRSEFRTAHALIRAEADHRDLTYTQYAAALEWLVTTGLLLQSQNQQLEAAPEVNTLADSDIDRLLFVRTLMFAAPPWLPDADIFVSNPGELPQDAARLAAILNLDEVTAFTAVRQVHGRVDIAERSRVGSAGERTLVRLLEQEWPGSVVHIALTDDGFGYDVVLNLDSENWHLEVKSTTRQGRSVVYLSRHEYDVAVTDPAWRLLLVRLDDSDSIVSLATIAHCAVLARAPYDIERSARWEATRFDIREADLEPGLTFLSCPIRLKVKNSLFLTGGASESHR